MTEKRHHSAFLLLWAILAGWSILLFFQGAYFASLFYGVQVPFWAAWVGQMPIWSFNLIDTAMLVVLIIGLCIQWADKRERSDKRSVHRSARGSAEGWVGVILLVLLVIVALAVLGFTASGLWSEVLKFFGMG